MATSDLKSVRQRKYVGRDFDSLRPLLLEYARLYYPDRIKDFSESGLGGLFLDFAAYVGDNASFYLDHQFNELSIDDAVENVNIERALRQAGVAIVGAAPATVDESLFIEVPAKSVNNVMVPAPEALPVVQQGTIISSDSGVEFTLLQDVDFSVTKSDGTLAADIRVGDKTSTGIPKTFIMSAVGGCVSGQVFTETFTVGSFVPFMRVSLSNPHVTEIISVSDTYGNTYYQVEALTHDVVYKSFPNPRGDSGLANETLRPVPAPYRFMTQVDLAQRLTTLTFGGGNANTLEDDAIPDPSDYAIPLKYNKTFSRLQIDPQQLLSTKTLGVIATNTIITVVYRAGGGLNHNVEHDQIKNVKSLNMLFPYNPSPATAAQVRGSVEATNVTRAEGGEDAPTVDELRSQVPAARNMQERVVTREDLLSRVYRLPSNFGRVFRAAVRSNPNNPLATQLYIISRDANKHLVISPDTLKQNIVTFLNPYRMISDAIDVLDASVVDLTLTFEVLVDPNLNKSIVLQNSLRNLQKFFDVKNFFIDQPIIIDDVRNAIAVPGVISVNAIQFKNASGRVNNLTYSDVTFDVGSNTVKGFIVPPPGGIFEVRYPETDIVGRAV